MVKIIAGNLPDEINVFIEIPMNDNPVKYEIKNESVNSDNKAIN